MLTDLTDTTTADIRAALAKTRDQMGGPATGVVLNLIIMTDESGQHDAVRAASQAGREHPCRVLAVIARESSATSRLDAEIRSGEGNAGPDRPAAAVRADERARRLGHHAAAGPRYAGRHLVARPAAGRPVSTAARLARAAPGHRRGPGQGADEALAALSAGYKPGDTDLSWTRATPWRSLLAATVDQEIGRDHRRSCRRRGAQSDGRPASPPGSAAGFACRSAARLPAGPASPRSACSTTRGRRRHQPARRPGGDPDAARPAGPARGTAATRHRRSACRGTAPAGPGRDLRRGAGLRGGPGGVEPAQSVTRIP